MGAVSRWAWNNLVAFDQLVNAFFGGDPDETISSRAGKSQQKGHRWACVLCRFLDLFQKDHCALSIEADEGEKSLQNLRSLE